MSYFFKSRSSLNSLSLLLASYPLCSSSLVKGSTKSIIYSPDNSHCQDNSALSSKTADFSFRFSIKNVGGKQWGIGFHG